MKKVLFCLAMVGLLGGLAIADEMKVQSGQNPFCKQERFPADYFLIHSNLPHFMKVFGEYGDDPRLALSKEQKAKLSSLQQELALAIVSMAERIKKAELEVMHLVVYEGKNTKDVEAKLQEIANLRLEMTKNHVECINTFYKTLSKEQYKTLLEFAGGGR